MAKLIGTNPNQVPSNADLGTAAFKDTKDFLTTRGSSLSAINSVITDSAVAVLVYDTRKDSDGGAWRHRMQHTSWYKEELNTPQRGSRREFPSVAVIVAEPNYVKIYDADDPTLPMWMVAYHYANGSTGGTVAHWHGGSGTVTCMDCRNGYLAIGFSSAGRGLYFSKDKMAIYYTATGGLYTPAGGIADRNLPYSAWVEVDEDYVYIPHDQINDIALWVNPGAPIDYGSGLPKPDIAIAHQSGLTYVKHDQAGKSGSTYDITANAGSTYNPVAFVNFTKDGKLLFDQDASARTAFYFDRPEDDTQSRTNSGDITDKLWFYGSQESIYPNYRARNHNYLAGKKYHYIDGGSAGLSILNPNYSAKENGMACYITSQFNTGWQPGGTKLATLTDNQPGFITADNMLMNGTFSSTTAHWTNNHGTYSISSGRLSLDGASTWHTVRQYVYDVTPGKQYNVRFTATGEGCRGIAVYGGGIFTESGLDYWYPAGYAGTNTYEGTLTATNSTINFNVVGYNTANLDCFFDNVYMTEAVADRSIKEEGGRVFGDLLRTQVNSNTDLVSYSNFSGTNYIRFANSSKFDIGTDDFTWAFWVKPNDLSGTKLWASLAAPGVNDNRVGCYTLSNGDTRFFLRSSGTEDLATTGVAGIKAGYWQHICGTRRGSSLYIYINGKFKGRVGTSKDITEAGKRLVIGADWDITSANAPGVEMALFRYIKAGMSEENIDKMYRDERLLFMKDAKCTFHGSSDTITAIAYDDDTNLLHVGTNAGRSVFQDLLRIDNTTNAVTGDISASGGLVVEV